VVTQSERAELQPGDVLAAIDGRPLEELWDGLSRYLSASTERYRRRELFYLSQSYLFPSRYTITLLDGRQVAIERGGAASAPMESTARWLEDRIAYLRVPSWAEPRFEARALELLEEHRAAAGLVVDVRGNNGGSTPSEFIAALMDRPWRWWAESTPAHFALYSLYAERRETEFGEFGRMQLAWPALAEEGRGLYTGPLVILIDEGCHSACEDFVVPFKDNRRATLVGEATAGSSGQPYVTGLGEGMLVAIGAKREYFPDGSRFEGVGITPDERVLPTAESLAAGRDPELERAIELLRRR
jgi:carboxyl-terminal processing protease